MKLVLFFIALSLGACSTKPVQVFSDLKYAMALGVITELNNINPKQDKDLLVRLYQVPVIDQNCFIETHGICQYKYYISVSTFDEQPEINVFELSHLGEITNVSWVFENRLDYIELEFTLNKYTKEALNNNHSLEKDTLKILIQLDPKNLIEKVQQ